MLNEEYQNQLHNDNPQNDSKLGEILMEEIRNFHTIEATIKQKKNENIKTMGHHELFRPIFIIFGVKCPFFHG